MRLISRSPILLLFLASLSLTLLSVKPSNAQTVEVQPSGSPYETKNLREIPVDNCGSTSESRQSVETSLSTQQSLTFEENIGVSAGGEVTISGVKVNLGAEIARKYGVTYGQELTERETLQLETPPRTHRIYILENWERWVDGSVSVTTKWLGLFFPTTRTFSYKFRTAAGIRQKGVRDVSCLAGRYDLDSWREAPRDVTMWMDVRSGWLKIDEQGNASWTLVIQERGENTVPNPQIACKGVVRESWKIFARIEDMNSIDWTHDIESLRTMVELAFCGQALDQNLGLVDRPFNLTLQSLGDGRMLLLMKNSEGEFSWIKVD